MSKPKPVGYDDSNLNTKAGYTSRYEGGRTKSPGHRGSGGGSTIEAIPYQVQAVRSLLQRAVGDVQEATKTKTQVEYHPVRLPYGMRGNRAICPVCYVESKRGRYDPETGRCYACT